MPYKVAIAFINWLPNHWYRVHAPIARLGFAVEAFMGVKHEGFLEYLEPWMRPDASEARAADPAFSPEVIKDVDLAFDLGLLSQAALVALGPKRLRASGAFTRDRVTGTSIRGG